MVPVSYWVLLSAGLSATVAMKTALGTTLLAVLPTVASGTVAHNKRRSVRWSTALVLGGSGLAGSMAGAALAIRLPGNALQVSFGVTVLVIALWMGVGEKWELATPAGAKKMDSKFMALCGFPIGMVTGLTGLGGGVLMVPVLVLLSGFPMQIAVGTSLAAIMFTSLGGAAGYVINGLGVPGMPAHFVGYVNLPVWLCLAAGSASMAQLGARTAHVLPARYLKYIFIVCMVYVGLRMIGVL